MKIEPFFHRDGATFHATEACAGPWDPATMHGAMIVGLFAYEIERQYGSAEYMPGRLCVDMYRMPQRVDPIQVSTHVVRDGYRIKVVDGEYLSNGVAMARCSCQLLRKTENAATRVWSPPNWEVPKPEEIPDPATGFGARGGARLHRPISGAMGEFGQKRIWMAERRDLLDDVPLTPWVRVALHADFANPWANSGVGGLAYINSDVTLYLHRLPHDEWIGMEVVNHHATDGIVLGECWMYDREGAIGTSTVTGLAQARPTLPPGSQRPAAANAK